MTIRRRQPVILAEYVQGDPVAWLEPIPCSPVRSEPLLREVHRHRVDRDPPRIARLVAEIDEAATFRRTCIRPWPAKEDE